MTDKTVMLMCLANIILYSTMLSAVTVTCLLFLETLVISLEMYSFFQSRDAMETTSSESAEFSVDRSFFSGFLFIA